MSLDSRLALLPYKSSSFATLKGKQEIVPLNLAPPRAEKCGGMGAKTSGYNEIQSREISCHHGIATLRSEISPLRSAAVEMTEARSIVFCNLSLANDCMLPADVVISSGGKRRYGDKNFGLY